MLFELFMNDLIFPSSDWITTTYDDGSVPTTCIVDETVMMERLSAIIHSSHVPPPVPDAPVMMHVPPPPPPVPDAPVMMPDAPIIQASVHRTATSDVYDYLPVEGDTLLWSCYVARHGFTEYTVSRTRNMVNEMTEKMYVSDTVQDNAVLLKRSSEKLTRDATSALATAIITLPELKHDAIIGLALYYRLHITLVLADISVYIEYAVCPPDMPDVKHILLYIGSSVQVQVVGGRRRNHQPKFWYNGEEGEDIVRDIIASREYFKINSITKPFHFPKCRREDLLEIYQKLKIHTYKNFELPQKPNWMI